MADIDVLLSASLKRIAQPGDAAGVADAIRARVDAGDTGTPATASGFGARPWWLFLLSGLLVILVAVTGVSVALGQPSPVTPTPDAASGSSRAANRAGYACIEATKRGLLRSHRPGDVHWGRASAT